MLVSDLMYDIPDREDIAKVIIDAGVVDDGKEPKLVLKDKSAKAKESKKAKTKKKSVKSAS